MQITNTLDAVWPVPFILDENVFSVLPELESYKLPSGLRVLLFPSNHSRSLKLEVFVNAGSIHQSVDKRGVPHFVEHMVFRSTKDFVDNEDLLRYAQDFNLDFNGYTAEELQSYHVIADIDDEATNAAAHLLSQVVLHPRLEEKYVEMEKQIIYAEQQAGESDPGIVTSDVQTRHFTGDNHPNGGGGIIGEADTILKFNHEDLINFHQKYFQPSNMLLVVSGGVGKSRMKALVDKYFLAGNSTGWTSNPLLNRPRETSAAETVEIRDFNHINTQVGLYLPKTVVPDYSLESYAKKVLWHALSTRLFLDVREKQGLAYSVYATETDFGTGRYLYIAGEFAKDKYIEGRKQMEKYMNEITDLKIDQGEFNRAIRALKSTRWADNVHHIAGFAARKLFLDGSLTSPEYVHKWIDQLTLDYVNELPKRLFADIKPETIVVGPAN